MFLPRVRFDSSDLEEDTLICWGTYLVVVPTSEHPFGSELDGTRPAHASRRVAPARRSLRSSLTGIWCAMCAALRLVPQNWISSELVEKAVGVLRYEIQCELLEGAQKVKQD